MRFRNYQNSRLTPMWVIIFVNILFYIGTSIASKSPNLLMSVAQQFGASSDTLASQPWTLVTAMFIHAGIMHILFNMVTLYFYSIYLLQIIGDVKYLLVYFIGGIVGNLVFILLAPNSIGVGASGAIFALGGVLAVMRPRVKVMLFPIPIPMDLWIAIIVGFVVVSFVGNVAWQAHLGGLLTGLIAGFYFRRIERRQGIRY